jgi:WD40 repeat protein/tetratricopeptide (TPR) repeat protein
VTLAVFDSDGCRLATTGHGMPVRVFDIGGLPPTLLGREYASAEAWSNPGADPYRMNGQSMEGISADGKRALLRVWPGASQLWDLETEKPLSPPQYIEGMSMNELGERCLLLKNRHLTEKNIEFCVGNVATGKEVKVVVETGPEDIRTRGFLSDDGRWLIIEGARDGSQIWNAETGQRVAVLPLAVTTDCSPDGRTLISFDRQGSMHGWELPAARLLWSTPPVAPKWPWPLDWQMPHVRFTRDNKSLLLARHEGDIDNPQSGERPSRLTLFDVPTGKQLFEPIPLSVSFYPRYALSADSQRLFVLDGDNTARLWNIRTGELLSSWKPDSPGEPTFSEDGKKIILTSTATREIRLWDPQQGKPLGPPLTGSLYLMSADTRMALLSFWPKKGQPWFAGSGSRVLQTETGLPLTPLGEDFGNHTHFHANGKRITTITGEHLVRRYDLVREERSIDGLKTLAGALSRYQIDDTGGFVFMDRPAFEKTWEAFKAGRLPADIAFTPRQRREWHVQAALDCLGGTAWEGALYHLDIVLRQEPGNRILHSMRAQAWRYLGQEAKALTELDKAVALEPRCRKLWEDRAMLHLRLGEEAKAAVDFSKVVELGSDNFSYWQHLALLHLAMKKNDDYSKLCQQLLDNVKPQGFFEPAEVLATCGLQPKAVDPARLLALAPDAKIKEDFASLKLAAIALFRAGKNAEASAIMERCMKQQAKDDYPPLAGADFAWAALIFHQAGQGKESEAWRRKGETWRDKEGKAAPWIYRAEFEHLSRELRASLPSDK